MTNDGAIVNGIMRARNRHEKEYQVEINKEITPEFLKKWHPACRFSIP